MNTFLPYSKKKSMHYKEFYRICRTKLISVSLIEIRHLIVLCVNLWHENGQLRPRCCFDATELCTRWSHFTHIIFLISLICSCRRDTESEQVLLNFSYRVLVLFRCGVRFTLYRENYWNEIWEPQAIRMFQTIKCMHTHTMTEYIGFANFKGNSIRITQPGKTKNNHIESAHENR